MPHHRARHTPLGRWEVVRRVVQDGETFAQAAAWANVSKSTVWEWVRRWRAASAEEKRRWRAWRSAPAGRDARRRRCPPRKPPGSASCASARAGARAGSPTSPRSHGRTRPSTRFCGAAGCSRRPAPERPAVIRYEWPCPGQLLHMDVKKFGKFTEPGHKVTGDRTRRSRRVGWEYCHSIVDDCSRLAYTELHDDERADTVTAFTAARAGLVPRARRSSPSG